MNAGYQPLGPRGRWVATAILSAIALTMLVPLYFIVVTMLKSNVDYAVNPLGPPSSIDTAGFSQAIESGAGFVPTFAHTILVVAASVVVIAGIATLGAFAISLLPPRGGRIARIVLVLLMIQPPVLLLYPTVIFIYSTGLVNTYQGLVLVYAGFSLPFATLLMYTHMLRMPRELLEAAEVDGASPVQLFTGVVLPLARPAIAAIGTLLTLWLWGEFLYAYFVLNSNDTMTVVVDLSTLTGSGFEVPVPAVMAGTFLTIAPPLLVAVVFNRTIISGLHAGAVRG